MSLVDKLEWIHKGDLILLRNHKGVEVTGYVSNYSTDKVTLSLTHPDNFDVKSSNLGFWEDRNIRPLFDRRTFKLKYFHEYEVLRKGRSE